MIKPRQNKPISSSNCLRRKKNVPDIDSRSIMCLKTLFLLGMILLL